MDCVRFSSVFVRSRVLAIAMNYYRGLKIAECVEMSHGQRGVLDDRHRHDTDTDKDKDQHRFSAFSGCSGAEENKHPEAQSLSCAVLLRCWFFRNITVQHG